MIYSRRVQQDFLEEELRAQTNNYLQKLNTPALYLLQEKKEMFIGQFLKFEKGEMILLFSNKRALPRRGDYLYCIVLPKDLRNYHNWEELTYGDLIKRKTNFSEIVCVWHSPSKEEGYSLVGFKGIDLEFVEYIKEAAGIALVMGPNRPPYEYISNLQSVVKIQNEETSEVLDCDFSDNEFTPYLLDTKKSVSDFVLRQIELSDTIILQGPPGTGKTFMIAEVCRELCLMGKSVLVTALTNRALMEIAEKKALTEMLNEGKIGKTNLSSDEKEELPRLMKTVDFYPRPGQIILSTFYITSGQVSPAGKSMKFDYVIMDEASQALLPMFAVAKNLGKKNIWIGDINQLPPVVEINEDVIKRKNYIGIVEGLRSLSENSPSMIYQLSVTHRLPIRAAQYTSLFYTGALSSNCKQPPTIPDKYICSKFLHHDGGPTLIKTDLPAGKTAPEAALLLAATLVKSLYEYDKDVNVAVLTCMINTTQELQRSILNIAGAHKKLIVETVARVQGLTTDYTIFVIPNASVTRSLERRLFNVATSRAKRNTIIITDKNILENRMSVEVKTFLTNLNNDFSFYLPFNKNGINAIDKQLLIN